MHYWKYHCGCSWGLLLLLVTHAILLWNPLSKNPGINTNVVLDAITRVNCEHTTHFTIVSPISKLIPKLIKHPLILPRPLTLSHIWGCYTNFNGVVSMEETHGLMDKPILTEQVPTYHVVHNAWHELAQSLHLLGSHNVHALGPLLSFCTHLKMMMI